MKVIEGIGMFEFADLNGAKECKWIKLYSDKVAASNSITSNPAVKFYSALLQALRKDKAFAYLNYGQL